ncbi:hypothetical protein [Streptomyces malaysiensis]|uniref:Uncharacterized protein n=1 Tax=Streptomyces malaysiensis subsp. samsunensis TaxID=459658 RepID=A0A9X2M1K4_STRMQ|nr:hypothetical protein [Streptomyces samsunensis]MCQ8833617.1 hypothetical protein [Streptomyces samsunensis]
MEADPHTCLYERGPAGVAPTPSGASLEKEARALLDRAEDMRARVAAATGPGRLTIGTMADGSVLGDHALVGAFRSRRGPFPHDTRRVSRHPKRSWTASAADWCTFLHAGGARLTRSSFFGNGVE